MVYSRQSIHSTDPHMKDYIINRRHGAEYVPAVSCLYLNTFIKNPLFEVSERAIRTEDFDCYRYHLGV